MMIFLFNHAQETELTFVGKSVSHVYVSRDCEVENKRYSFFPCKATRTCLQAQSCVINSTLHPDWRDLI